MLAVAIATVSRARPCDIPIFCGVYYAGEWYPPTDPRGKEVEKLRYLLLAPTVQSLEEWHSVANGYDATCGMQSRPAWAYDFMVTIFQAWLDAETQWHQSTHKNLGMLTEIGPRGFASAAHIYLASVGVHRLNSKSRSVVIGDMAWYVVALYDFFARLRYPAKFEAPTQPVVPQDLQSNEAVLEQIAMSKLPVASERIDEMVQAVEFAVEHWGNLQARVLFDGYELKQSFNGAFIMLKHPEHPSGVTIGSIDPETRRLVFVSRRGEIREFMHKVAAGMKPSDNPKLPGVTMQAPIPDDVKMSPQIQTLKNLTESQRALAEVLATPLFADDGR